MPNPMLPFQRYRRRPMLSYSRAKILVPGLRDEAPNGDIKVYSNTGQLVRVIKERRAKHDR